MDFVPPSCEYDDSARPGLPDADRLAVAIGAMASLASFEEVLLSPKPGLVCPDSAGSHSDMNWATFAAGASALAPFWRVQALEGARFPHYKPLEELGANLRLVGREMESAMFEATGGVNTHKGLIFALSLIVGASGLCFSRGRASKDSVLKTAGDLIRASVTEEMEDIGRRGRRGEELTHGEKIYFLHGIGGIRAEAKNGFPSVKKGLDALEEAVSRGAALRDAAISALLVLMAECEDTNVMHRGGVRFWSGEYKEMTRDAMAKFDPVDPRFYESVRYLDKRLIERGASPGGAADLLACTLFMYRSII